MIIYRFSIDGVIINEPDNIRGWDRLVTQVKRNSTLGGGLLVSQEVQLEFVGDLYRKFKNKYFKEGVCVEVTIQIEQSFDGINYSMLHDGIIKIRDVVLKDILTGIAQSKVNDNSYYAKINNNQNVSTNPKGASTKNGVPITGCANFAVELYNPIDGLAIGDFAMISVYRVMKYLVSFMSDDEVEFESDFLQNDLQMMMQCGLTLRTGLTTPTEPIPYWQISFNQLYSNIAKLRDIGYIIELNSVTNKPVLRIELKSYFETDTAATDSNGNEIKFINPVKLETSVKIDELISTIKLGTEKPMSKAENPTLTYPDDTGYESFADTQYYLLGNCNIDKELNLTTDLLISSNAIEDCVVGASHEYDDDLFLIVVENIDEVGLTANALMSNPTGSMPPSFYNMDLRNSQRGKSFFFQGDLVAGFLNLTSNAFEGFFTSQIELRDNTIPPIPLFPNPALCTTITYQNEVDFNNNFNLTSYTCPLTGWYTFKLFYKYFVDGFYSGNGLDITFTIVNGGATILIPYDPTITTGNIFTGELSPSIYLLAGTVVSTEFCLQAQGTYNQPIHQIFRLLSGTVFSCTSAPDTGGRIQTYDPEDVRNILMKFDYPIKPQDFNSILENLRGKYAVQCDVIGETYQGWIESLKYDHKTTIANIVLKTSVNTIGLKEQESAIHYPAWRFDFDMINVTEEIQSFTYNSGVSNVLLTSSLTQPIADIKTDIETAFTGVGISTTDIIITRYSIGGALFHYRIDIINPNTDITILSTDLQNSLGQFFIY